MFEDQWFNSDCANDMVNYLTDFVDPTTITGPVARPSERKLRLMACAFWHNYSVTQYYRSSFERRRRKIKFLEQYADGEIDYDTVLEELRGDIRGGWYPANKNASLAARLMSNTASLVIENNEDIQAHADIVRELIDNPFRPTIPSPMPPNSAASSDMWGLSYGLALEAYNDAEPNGLLKQDRLNVLSDALEDAGLPTQETIGPIKAILNIGIYPNSPNGWKLHCSHVTPNMVDDIPRDRIKPSMFKRKIDAINAAVQLYNFNNADPSRRSTSSTGSCWGTGCIEITKKIDNRILKHLRSPKRHYKGCWALDLILGKC